MRNAQRPVGDDPVAVQKQVEVDLTRAPLLTANPSEQLFDLEQPPQCRARRKQRSDPDDRVQVPGLRRSDRLGLVDGRGSPEEEPWLARELFDGGTQRFHAVAQVGAQADVRIDHCDSRWSWITATPDAPSITPPP